MNALRRSRTSTPLRLFAGSFLFLAGCHHHAPPPAAPEPVPNRVPPAPPPAPAIATAPSLMQAMHDTYAPTWFRNVTFTQRTTLVSPGAAGAAPRQTAMTWYESIDLPGRRRIDTDLASKGGVLFRHDSTYNFNDGKLVHADTGVDELLVLGFDVYAQPSARSDAQLRRLGFDLRRFHEGTWQGRQVFVVGAERGDLESKQFWVDRESLLFVRLLERTPRGHTDIRFDKYVRVGGGWIATEMEQYVNGALRLREEYSDIKTNVQLSDGLFDPKQWATAPHWARR